MAGKTLEYRDVKEGELLPRRDGVKLEGPVYTPAVDILETEEGLTLEADLPGVTPETLEIELEDGVLRIIGRAQPYVPVGATPLYEEYQPGSYVRWFIVGEEVDQERISARMADGVLELTLPKAEVAKPRRIQVETE